MTGKRGWVPITPDGMVMWTGASWKRRAAMDWVSSSFGEPRTSYINNWQEAWRRMYRAGWRVVRCELED